MNTAPLPPPYLGRQHTADRDPHATVDAVTHVWSRLAILQVAARMLDAARKRARPVGFVLVSIDPSSSIRTMYGPGMGDAMLGEICRRVRKALTATDAVGRYGRDELLIVLPSRDHEIVASTADRILQTVKAEPVIVSGVMLEVTVAIGATIADAGAGEMDEAIAAASVALHRAKDAGGDCVEMRWQTASERLLLTS